MVFVIDVFECKLRKRWLIPWFYLKKRQTTRKKNPTRFFPKTLIDLKLGDFFNEYVSFTVVL